MYEDIYENLLEKVLSGNEAVLLTFMKSNDNISGQIASKFTSTIDNLKDNLNGIDNDELLYDKSLESIQSGNPLLVEINDHETVLIEPFFPEPRLVILGGGHIAKPLGELGARAGFSVAVVDDRPFFANKNCFPDANEIICDDFEIAIEKLQLNKADFVVIVTRGHKHDGVCLRKVLGYETNYVGMIGSNRRVKGMMDQLLAEGYSQDTLDKIYSPIGLRIGAVTPDEIAISIIAEIIGVRRNGKDGKSIRKSNWPEFDEEVIREILNSSEPKALITIMSSRGSVPRKAGAKMIAWYDGRTLGSIGGGCSEAEVLTRARDVILDKGYATVSVDMTAEVAASEGMVCGGTMEVLIESF